MKSQKPIFFLLLLSLVISLPAQDYKTDVLTHTFSIVARDPLSGDLGVAVQSHWFSVGSIVSWAEAGVGAIATQSLVNVSFGPRGLELLRQGKSAEETLDALIAADEGRDFRQVAIVDTSGNVAVYTGEKCISDAGHIRGKNYSVQANMMINKEIWPKMSEAFENSSGPLAERLISALKAAQQAGGDIRGQQSSSLLVVRGKASKNSWENRLVDLRVEDHPDAVNEIARLLKVHRAFEHMNRGDLAIEEGDEEKALEEYAAAEAMFPDNLEMKYWAAVSLVNMGRLEEALPIFRKIFREDPNWIELSRRIVPNGFLKADPEQLKQIINCVDD